MFATYPQRLAALLVSLAVNGLMIASVAYLFSAPIAGHAALVLAG